jgi:hypothetical protein
MVYVLAVTSCSRFDLLKQTLDSFFAACGQYPRRVYVVEDSATPKPEWLNAPEWRARNIEWISNGRRMGQAYSIARLIDALATQDVKQIFWCEDDWLFTDGDFLKPSFDLLDQHSHIIQVSLRGNNCNGHPVVNDSGLAIKILEPGWREGWGGFSFNPSAMRLADLKRIRPALNKFFFKHGLSFELELSREHIKQGYRIASLRQCVQHLGGGRSRAIEPLPGPPNILIAIPACFALEYGAWESEQSPLYDAAKAWQNRPYGTDIHISGVNPRIQAVRETWAKDVAAFPNVTLKFFYGKPADGYPREPLADEIFLNCADDYEHLPQKTIAICQWALTQDYAFIFKADDDSYVWVDRLIRELVENPPFDYAGYLNGMSASGGPGYWLSRRGAEIVTKFSPRGWAEDQMVGQALNAANIAPVMLPNHRPGFAGHYFDLSNIPSDAVCIHAVRPEGMYQLHSA